jgi:hypothetical protein
MTSERALRFGGIGLALLAGLALQGCREEEQDRILLYQKGTYLGPADTSAPAAELAKLDDRAAKQKF